MAYNAATLVQKDPPSEDRRVRLVIEFTGNAGEPVVRREYYVSASDTVQTIRRWCIDQAKNLGDVRTVADALTVGQSINLSPIAPPVATAEQVWGGKVERFRRLDGLGLTGQAATDLAALRADIEATYLTAYL